MNATDIVTIVTFVLAVACLTRAVVYTWLHTTRAAKTRAGAASPLFEARAMWVAGVSFSVAAGSTDGRVPIAVSVALVLIAVVIAAVPIVARRRDLERGRTSFLDGIADDDRSDRRR